MRNPAKVVHVDFKHANNLIGDTKQANGDSIDYRDLHIGPEFMLKELFSYDTKSQAALKYFSRKKKWDQMAKVDSIRGGKK